jgi:hypothetical protein
MNQPTITGVAPCHKKVGTSMPYTVSTGDSVSPRNNVAALEKIKISVYARK